MFRCIAVDMHNSIVICALCAQAHKLELCVSNVAKSTPWMARYEKVLRALYRRWKTSPKKAANAALAGTAIDDKAHALKGLHGIRWMSSKMSAVVSLAKAWRVQVASLHEELVNANAALRGFQRGVSLATPDAELIGIQIVKRFLRHLFVGTIMSYSARQTSLDDDVVLFKVGLVCAYLHKYLVSYCHFCYDLLLAA